MYNLDNSSNFYHHNPQDSSACPNSSRNPLENSGSSSFGQGQQDKGVLHFKLIGLLQQGLIEDCLRHIFENPALISKELIKELVAAGSFTDPLPKASQSLEEQKRFASLAERDRIALIKSLLLCAKTLPECTRNECLKGIAGDNLHTISVCREVLKDPCLKMEVTIEALVQLSSDNDSTGIKALKILKRLQELALPGLLGLINKFALCPFHSDKQIALKQVIQSIGEHSPDYAIKCLTQGLSHSNSMVRASALEVLSSFELSEETLFSAAYHLIDPELHCQLAAIDCVLSSGSAKATPFIKDLFALTGRDAPFKVKCAALEAIGKISKADDHTFTVIRNEWETVKKLLYHPRHRATDPSQKSEVNMDEYLGSVLTAAASYYSRDRRCSTILTEAQQSSLSRVRGAVAYSLSNMESYDLAKKFLQQSLKDKNVKVRRNAIASAAKHGRRAYNLLIVHLHAETDNSLMYELGGILRKLMGKDG